MHLSNVKKYSRKRYRTISNWTGTSVDLELFMFVHQSYISGIRDTHSQPILCRKNIAEILQATEWW
jgi:hypothetical protein